MRLSRGLRRWLLGWAVGVMARRGPDVVIGGEADPYLERWHLVPRNPLLNVYLHRFLRSDDDRALHDHPWTNASLLLAGCYLEWSDSEWRAAAGQPGAPKRGLLRYDRRSAGEVIVRGARAAHRVELIPAMDGSPPAPVVTLFVTGPRLREWGFWCRHGWVHWRDFTAPGRSGEIGPGCEGPASRPGRRRKILPAPPPPATPREDASEGVKLAARGPGITGFRGVNPVADFFRQVMGGR